MIRSMRTDGLTLRAAALLSAGALAVHELRYLVGYGGGARGALLAHGHSYLAGVTTGAGLLLLLALAGFVAKIARGGAARPTRRRTWSTAASAGGALLAVYSFQELVEGLVASGHPGGFAGVYGQGGWSAVLFAAAIGLVIALLLRGADALLAHVAARRRDALARPDQAAPVGSGGRVGIPRRLGLARNAAGRAPPASFA